MAFNQGTLSKDPRFNALLPKRIPVAKPRRPINVDTSDFVETRQPAVQGGIPADYRFTDEVNRSAVQRLIGNPVTGISSGVITKKIPVTEKATMTPTALARQAGTVGLREGQLPSWGQVKQQAYAPVDFTTDILNSIDDTRDGDEPVADTITPNKQKVTVADPNGNAQEVNTPINNFRNAIADFIREEPPANPHEYWRSMFTDGNHIPDALLRQNALDEAKMYGMGGNEDMANARMANQIRQQIQELNRRYTTRQLSVPGDLEGNRTEYLRQFEPLNARLTELTGVGATFLQDSNDPMLRRMAAKQVEPLYKYVNDYNNFISAKPSSQKLMAQSLMKDISGDKGTLSDMDVARFNLASLSPEDRATYQRSLQNFVNAFTSAVKTAGKPQFAENYNRAIQIMNNALDDEAYMGAARDIQQAMSNLQQIGADLGNYQNGVNSLYNVWNNQLNVTGALDMQGITGLMEERIRNASDDPIIWAEQNEYEGMQPIVDKILSQLKTGQMNPAVTLPRLIEAYPEPVEPTPQRAPRDKTATATATGWRGKLRRRN